MRNLQEQVKKAFCYQKLFWPFTVWINCSSDLKIFANSRPSASNFKSFSRSLEQFFLTVGQNNFGNKIPLIVIFLGCLNWKGQERMILSTIIILENKIKVTSILHLLHCNPLQGKYRFFTGNSLCSISTLTCFGSVQGLKGANFIEIQRNTGSSRLMRISLLRISLLRFFKTITKIWLMRFYGLFILLLRT